MSIFEIGIKLGYINMFDTHCINLDVCIKIRQVADALNTY